MGLLRSPSGAVVTVPDDQVEGAKAGGYTDVSDAEASRSITAIAHEDTGALGAVGAGLSSVASGATLGLSDIALKGVLSRGDYEQVAADREAHPGISGVGQFAGALLPSIVAPESLLARAPAGYLSRATAGAVSSAKALGGAAGVVGGLTATGVEGAIYGAGSYLSETALGDRDLTAEGLSGALGTGFAFGAATAGVLHGVEAGTIAARRMFARTAEGGEQAALDAASAWERHSAEVIEANDAAAEVARAKLVTARAARDQAALAKDRAAAAIATERAGAPAVDAELAGARRLDDNINKIETQEASPAAAVPGGPDDSEALLRFAQGQPAAAAPVEDLSKLEEALAEHDAAKSELDDMLKRIQAPEPGEVGGRIEKLPGKFGEPDLAQGTPVNPENRALMDALDARARQGEATAVGKRPQGVELPVLDAPPATNGNQSLEDLLRGTKAQLDSGQSLGEVAGRPKLGEIAARGIEPQAVAPSASDPASVFTRHGVHVEFKNGFGDDVLLSLKSGDAKGKLVVKKVDGQYQVSMAELDDKLHGKGIGTAMYTEMASYLETNFGKPLISDTARTKDAERLWERLERQGLAKRVEDAEPTPGEPPWRWQFVVPKSTPSPRGSLEDLLAGTKAQLDGGASLGEIASGSKLRKDYVTSKELEVGKPLTATPAAAHEPAAQDGKNFTESFTVKQKHMGEVPLRMAVETKPSLVGGSPRILVRVERTLSDGEIVNAGDAELFHRPNGELYPESVNVDEPFQRLGIATRMYQAAERASGGKVIPSLNQTEHGAAFSAKYRGSRGANAHVPSSFASAEAAGVDTSDLNALLNHVEAEARGPGRPLVENSAPIPSKSFDGIPDRDALSHELNRLDTDYVENTVPASTIAERGYYEPPGGHADAVRTANAKKAIAEGQRDPIKLNISKSGKITVTDGRHRLEAAIESGAPIKVKWSTGFEPAESDVLRAGKPAATDISKRPATGAFAEPQPATTHFDIANSSLRYDQATKTYHDAEGSLTPVSAMRQPVHGGDPELARAMAAADAAHPLSIRKLEIQHDELLEQAMHTADAAERRDLVKEAAAIEKQMTAVGARPGAVEDVAAIAPVVTRYEKAGAAVAEALGAEAPPAAREAATAFRAAEDAAERRTMSRVTRAIDDHAEAPERVQVGKDRRPSAIASSTERIAAARASKLEADAALANARVTESEARLGATAAKQAAKDARASAGNQAPAPAAPPAKGGAWSRIRDVGTVVEAAGMVIPGIPKPDDIPVIGPLLGTYLKYRALKATAGRFVGRVPATANARAAALAARTKDKIASAVDASLGLVERAAKSPATRTASVAASARVGAALARRVFDDGEPDAPKKATPTQLAAVRIREIAAAATNPQKVIVQVRRELADVTDPDLIEAAEKHRIALYQHLNDRAPKAPPPSPFVTRPWEPSPAMASQFARRLEVAHDPAAAFEALQQQCLTPEAADTLRAAYPKLFVQAQQRLLSRASDVKSPIPYQQRLRNSLLFDVPLDASMEPDTTALLQSAHVASSPGPAASPSAPPGAPPVPSIAGPTNLTALYQPGLDRRASMR